MSKNEIKRDNRYNKHLFIRVRHGCYLPNPRMEIQVGSEWVNVYDAIGVFQESNLQNPRVTYLAEQIEEWRKNLKDLLA